MDIKQIYREETELDVYTVALMEQRVEHFSDDYVKWLEAKLNSDTLTTKDAELFFNEVMNPKDANEALTLANVSQQREQLKSFCKYIDLESKAHPEDIKIDIENHLKIFNCG